MITLFPDQLDLINQLKSELSCHKRVLMRAETGFGKSVCASYMIRSALDKGKKSAFIVPRKELLRQMAETFDDFEIPYGFVASGKPLNPYARVHLCTDGTLVNNLDKIDPDIIFDDEVHFGAGRRDKINTYYTNKGKYIVGLTATPENKLLHKWYDSMVDGSDLRTLIDLGRLSDYRYFAPSSPDLKGIKKTGNDYNRGDLDDFMMSQRVLVGDAVKHYKEHAMGRLNMTFCTSVKTSERAASDFRAAGIPSVHMDGDTPEDERKRIAKAFANREILNLCTVDLCLFGYDLASASGVKNVAVESMSDLRPTKSRNVQRQKIGRCLRRKDFPALIFDHSNNWMEHGLPDEKIEWSLEPPENKSKKPQEKSIPTRQCDNCYFIHPPSPTCPECGYSYPIKSREINQVDGFLEEIDPKILRAQQVQERKKEQGQARTLEELIEVGKRRGMSHPTAWASKIISARMRGKR